MFAWLKSLFRRKHNIVRIPSEFSINDLAYPDKFAAITAACRTAVVQSEKVENDVAQR